jgi:hypothetical protein
MDTLLATILQLAFKGEGAIIVVGPQQLIQR